MRRSNKVDDAIKDTYALLATAAAKKAMSRVEWNDTSGADRLMVSVERWLEKAGARATSRHYSKPRV